MVMFPPPSRLGFRHPYVARAGTESTAAAKIVSDARGGPRAGPPRGPAGGAAARRASAMTWIAAPARARLGPARMEEVGDGVHRRAAGWYRGRRPAQVPRGAGAQAAAPRRGRC